MNYYSETIFNLSYSLENILKKDQEYNLKKEDLEVLTQAIKKLQDSFVKLSARI
jgi:hypothetical protein